MSTVLAVLAFHFTDIFGIIATLLVFILCIIQIEPKNEIKHTLKLDAINGTNNFRIFSKKGSDEKPWFDSRGDIRHVHCVRPAKCEKLTLSTCFGAKIPYAFTSLDLTDDFNQEQIKEKLNSYQALKHIPRCWASVQPFLCAVFLPKCERINNIDFVYLPSLEMCKIVIEPCKILANTTYFPEFLRCNETLFPPKCNNDVREMKFNTTGKCLLPLVAAESSSGYYPGVEGCGVKCENPLFTEDEHRQIHKLIAWGATLCIIANSLVVITFFIDWQNANKYPAVIVFYINLCFLISCLGWIAQFTPGSREDIVCRKDGTIRHSEPSAGGNLSCIIVFVLVYYFLTAAMIWFVFLTYAWNLQAIGKDRVEKKGSYFHLIGWSLPLVLTITTMALSEVDGNSTAGVCFVGYMNHAVRTALLLGPLCGVIIIGGCFIVLGTVKLCGRKIYLSNIKSTSASKKIHFIILRMGLCAIIIFMFIFVVIICHINEFRNSKDWEASLKQYIICKIMATFKDNEQCKLVNRPSVAMLQLHLLCLFSSGIVMSSWCWTPSSIETWRRYIRKKFKQESFEDIKIQKHKIIAQTWAKRMDFDDQGRLSITLFNTFTDPVGLNFDVNDLNSSESNEISSTWANYLPLFVKRRLALTGATTNSSSYAPRKSSLDSEFSFSVRHVSVESRRNSIDSQVSVKIAEMKTKVASRSRSSKHSKGRSRRRKMFFTHKKYSRRESSTSFESQVIALKKMLPEKKQKVGIFTQSKVADNLKRRSASRGLAEADVVNSFISKNGQILFPFLQEHDLTTTSDEETSRASFTFRGSRFDILFQQQDKNETNISTEKVNEFSIDEMSPKTHCGVKNILKRIQTSSSLSNIISFKSKDNYDSITSQKSNSNLKSKLHNHSSYRNIHNLYHLNESSKLTRAEIRNNSYDLNKSCVSFFSGEKTPISSKSWNSGLRSNKTLSRNSKISCDVGIQTNDSDLIKEVLPSRDPGKQFFSEQARRKPKRNRINCKDNVIDSDEQTENQHLLLTICKSPIEDLGELEKTKLQMLLLPSKFELQ